MASLSSALPRPESPIPRLVWSETAANVVRIQVGSCEEDPRMFFGWYIVAAGLTLGMYQSGSIGFGFTAFIAPIAATYGWTYAQISLGLAFRGLEVGTLDPLVGMAVDRFPARRLVLLGVIMYGLGLVGISQAPSLILFYVSFIVLGIGSSLAMHVVPQTLIARWFKKDLGKASAILTMGGPIGGTMLPLLVKLIDTFTWQTSLLILAAGVWIIGIPLSFVFRLGPKERDTSPHERADTKHHGKILSSHFDYDYGVKARDALKMPVFWRLGIGFLLLLGSLHAVITHVMPYLTSLGIDRSTASMVAMAVPLVSLLCRIPFGWLADTFRKTHVLALSMALTAAGLFFFWLIDGTSMIVIGLFVVVFGMGFAGWGPIRTPLIREYFGTKNFGTIYGLISVFNMISMLAYPPVAGWVYDTSGSYKPIWLIFALGSALGAFLVLTAPLPGTLTGQVKQQAE